MTSCVEDTLVDTIGFFFLWDLKDEYSVHIREQTTYGIIMMIKKKKWKYSNDGASGKYFSTINLLDSLCSSVPGSSIIQEVNLKIFVDHATSLLFTCIHQMYTQRIHQMKINLSSSFWYLSELFWIVFPFLKLVFFLKWTWCVCVCFFYYYLQVQCIFKVQTLCFMYGIPLSLIFKYLIDGLFGYWSTHWLIDDK